MKGFALSVLMFFVMICANAQSVEKRLHSHITSQGTVYFVSHKSLSKHDKGVKKFEYDLTYVAKSDSATINFTLVSPAISDVKALVLTNGTESVEAGFVELLYHEAKKKDYLIRTSARVPYQQLKSMLQGDAPVVFNITRTNGVQNRVEYSVSQWKKEKQMYARLFYMIE